MTDTGYPPEDEDPFGGRDVEDLEAELGERRGQLQHAVEVFPESLAIPIYRRRVEALEREIATRHAQAAQR